MKALKAHIKVGVEIAKGKVVIAENENGYAYEEIPTGRFFGEDYDEIERTLKRNGNCSFYDYQWMVDIIKGYKEYQELNEVV